MVADNQEANITVGESIPIVERVTVTTGGVLVPQVNYQDVGIILDVEPHINPDGFVRMEILQTVSDITGSTVDLGQGLTSPIFLDREAETTVTVKDNETVVLGGLITTRDETREQKVPILGDIPLLGWLARNEIMTSSRTELLVILTPRVVRTIDDYRELSVQERDRTGYLPDEVLTSELMNELRVSPEDLAPAEGEGLLGPFPEAPADKESDAHDREVYGPQRASSSDQGRQEQGGGDPDSYDVPISWAGSVSRWADRAARQHR